MQEPKPKAVTVAPDQLDERSTILVIGEDRFTIAASVHRVRGSFVRPLQVTRYASHEGRFLRAIPADLWCNSVHNRMPCKG